MFNLFHPESTLLQEMASFDKYANGLNQFTRIIEFQRHLRNGTKEISKVLRTVNEQKFNIKLTSKDMQEINPCVKSQPPSSQDGCSRL